MQPASHSLYCMFLGGGRRSGLSCVTQAKSHGRKHCKCHSTQLLDQKGSGSCLQTLPPAATAHGTQHAPLHVPLPFPEARICADAARSSAGAAAGFGRHQRRRRAYPPAPGAQAQAQRALHDHVILLFVPHRRRHLRCAGGGVLPG